MIKKITLLIIATICICNLSFTAMAQQINTQDWQVLAEIYKDQKPITEDEIKEYIKILPKLKDIANDSEKVLEVISSSTIEPMRFSYVAIKVPFALVFHTKEAGWEELEKDLPEIFKPNTEEIKIVTKYIKEIEKIMNQ